MYIKCDISSVFDLRDNMGPFRPQSAGNLHILWRHGYWGLNSIISQPS